MLLENLPETNHSSNQNQQFLWRFFTSFEVRPNKLFKLPFLLENPLINQKRVRTSKKTSKTWHLLVPRKEQLLFVVILPIVKNYKTTIKIQFLQLHLRFHIHLWTDQDIGLYWAYLYQKHVLVFRYRVGFIRKKTKYKVLLTIKVISNPCLGNQTLL